MLTLLHFLLVLWVFLNIIHIWFRNVRKKPPGPLQWPILGNVVDVLLANPRYPHSALVTLAKKYGDVMSLKYGTHDLVILSSFKAMKDLLTRDEVCGHHVFPFTTDRAFGKNLGILTSSGNIWRESKRFTMRGLREFGFGRRNSMDVIIREEIQTLIAQFQKITNANDGILTIDNTFTLSVTNIIWSLIAGYRFPHDDETLNQMLRYNEELNSTFSAIYTPFPCLRYLFPTLTKFNQHQKAYKAQHDFMMNLLDKFRDDIKHREELEDDKPQNFIEILLKKQESDPTNQTFNDENIIIILLDLFLAGSETTSNTLSCAILYMILHPEVQRKIQNEITSVVLEEQEISASDIQRMPYTKACIYETLRFSNVVPIPFARTAVKDVLYEGFIIRRGTGIVCNNHANFFDQKFWGDPEIFRPERFLDKENKLVNTERVTAFGFGKHACLGESLSWDTLFLFLTSLLRKFTFSCDADKEILLLNDPREGYFTLAPKPFNVHVKDRL